MQFRCNFVVLAVLSILTCQSSAWSLVGYASERKANNATVTNQIESGSDSKSVLSVLGYLASWGTSSMNNNRPPSHDTPPSRCRCSCGERNYDARVVGGKETLRNIYPWMARLSYLGQFFCGGTLINDRYVLTAAHCVKRYTWFLIKVTFGEHNRCDPNEQPETRYVLRAISQPFNIGNYNDDIALLRLNDRVPINEVIRPICLPNRRSSHYAGKNGIVAGWGSTTEEGSESCVLNDVKIPIITNLECIQSSSYGAGMVTENMMCARNKDGKVDSCQGDSGGPLMVERNDKRFEIAGIVSWGIGCGQIDYPGVYARVTRYLSWIRQNTRDACYCR